MLRQPSVALLFATAWSLLAIQACVGSDDCQETGTCSSIGSDGSDGATALPDAAEDASPTGIQALVVRLDKSVGDTAGGTRVTITGEHFLGATGATIGGVPLTTFIVANDREITGVTGAHAKGVVDVVVTKSDTSATARGVFEYFDPTAIVGCVWWLRADLGVQTMTGEVTSWTDQSGIGDPGRNATPNGTDKPAYNAKDAQYNNKATIGTFNKMGAANDCRLRTGIWRDIYSAPGINGDPKAITLGVVGHADSTSNRYFTFASGSDYLALLGAASLPTIYAGSSSLSLRGSDEEHTDVPKTFFMAEFNGASSKLFLNATATPSATGDLGTTTTLGDEPIHVGSYATAAQTYGVERLAEVFAYSRVLSETERTKLRAYLNDRYGKAMTK